MADEQLTRRARRLRTDPRAWARVLGIYLAARVVTSLLIVVSTALAPPDGRHGADPSLLDYIVGWDGAWYREIALNGYPTELPVDDAGNVGQNAWAFMPVYPMLARALTLLVPGAGAGSDDVWAVATAWAVCAALVSFVAGFFACWALYALLVSRIGRGSALWAVAFVAAGPLAVMFHVAYAEALFLAAIMAALVCLDRERWWWIYPLMILAAFTRPGELALPLTVALYGLWRIRGRRERPIARREVVHILGTGAVGTLAGFCWPIVANTVTGNANAYFATELAWRRGWVPDAHGFVPGEGWIQAAEVWTRLWGIPSWAGYVILAALAAGAIAMFFTPAVRAIGIVPRLWVGSYLVYVVLVVFPQSSVIRLLLPLAPLGGAVAAVRMPRSTRILVLVGCVAVQFWWIHVMYGIGNTYYLVP